MFGCGGRRDYLYRERGKGGRMNEGISIAISINSNTAFWFEAKLTRFAGYRISISNPNPSSYLLPHAKSISFLLFH